MDDVVEFMWQRSIQLTTEISVRIKTLNNISRKDWNVAAAVFNIEEVAIMNRDPKGLVIQ